MKNPIPKKNILEEQYEQELDDCEELPEEMESETEEEYEETTEEITEDDFSQFKDSLPSDWEG